MQHPIVSRAEWLEERKALLAEEKAFTRLRDRLNEKRRALPWVKFEKDYFFQSLEGPVTLADLFNGHSQLFIKHFMLGPGQPLQCVGCSLEVDHVESILPHLMQHDLSYVVVARAPLAEIEVVRQRMNWQVKWVSSFGSDFNYDFNVSFTAELLARGGALYNFQAAPEWAAALEDLSGDSVFYKNDEGQIFHTYSTFGRGGEEFLGIYRYLDITPNGRNEIGPSYSLADWARPKPLYGKGGNVEASGRYHPAGCQCIGHRG